MVKVGGIYRLGICKVYGTCVDAKLNRGRKVRVTECRGGRDVRIEYLENPQGLYNSGTTTVASLLPAYNIRKLLQ